MPMNDDDFMAVFTGQAKVSKQRYSVIPDMGTDTSYIEQERKKNASESAIDFSFLDDDSLSTIDKLKKFWRVQTNSQTPDERLESAEKVGNALGIVPQTLAENDDLYKNALLTYEQQRNNAYLQGKPFTPQTVAQLYPELDTEDTVATTMALRDYNNILKTRMAISQGVPVYSLAQDDSLWGTYTSAAKEGAQLPGFLFGKISDLATKAYNAGQAMDQQSELMYKASIGEISDEDVEKAIPGLLSTQKDFKTEMGDNYIARIVGEAISQLSMQKNMMMRGAEKILAPIIPLAQPVLQAAKINIPQMGAMGSAAAAGALGMSGVAAGAVATGGAALAGLLTLGTASVFVGTYRAEAGQAYWEWRTKKDKFGKSLYTREQAIGHAKRVGMVNAAIETGAWELAFKGVAKVWGNEAASAVIKNTDAMKKLIGAGRGAIRKQALLHGAKQFAKVAIPETVEEGLQSMTSDLDTNIYGKGDVSTKEIFNNALDAMVEAIPSVIGMSIGGSALGGIGAYKAMKKISGLSEMKEAVTEFKRQNENSMLQKVMELREDSSLYHKAPEAYRKTIQKQMDQVDMGTVYIDAQAAAENESTHEALNEMVEKGIVSAKELDESIKTGKPLAVESGKYMQLASEETPEILADYSTMDKGERTLHAIKEERQRYKDMVDIVTSTKKKREAAASEKILKEHFSEDTEQGREDRATAQELLSGGLEHLQENYKTLLDDAKKAWGDLTDVGELQDYMERRKGQNATTSTEKGVDFVDIDQGDSWSHIRASKNPDWYQDFYSDYGRAPNQRELYDIAHDKTIIENDRGDEDFKVHKQELEIAKAKVESLERVGEVIKTLDKKDLIAQTLLDPDTYEQAYKPLLEQITKAGNEEVTQAARDSALILAKLAENFHKNYGVPLELATIAAGKVSPKSIQQLHQEIRKQHGFSDKASDIIKKEIKTINRNDIPADKIDRLIYSELSKKTPEELLADTVKTLKSYAKDKITDPMGDRIYLAPAKGESFEQYATHLIAGHEEKVDDGSRSRALGVKLLLQTLTNPMAIVLQDNGRKKYLAIYDDGISRLHQIIVEAQKDENGRIVTSFVKEAKRKDKGAPYARFKNEIATSKKVLYIRGLNDRKGLSGHSRPPVEQWASQVSANLHPIGNYIIAREELENNENMLYPKSVQQLHQAVRNQKGFSDKARNVILEEVQKWTKETIPSEHIDEKLYNDLLGMSNEELFQKAKSIVTDLIGNPKNPKKYIDPLGNEIYFAPGDTETLDQYTLHLTAGMGKEIKDIRAARVLGIVLAKKTIEDPLAIVTEDSKLHHGDKRMEDRKVYISSYKGVNGYANTMVIGVEKGQDGRVITSTLTVGDKRKKGKAVYEIKKVFKTSKKLLYVRGVNNRDSLSGHSRPPSDHWVSTLNAKLHPIGNYIIAREELENNESPLYQMASEHAKWEARLKEDEKKWNDTLDKFAEGKAPTRSLRVMNTPLVLQLLSAKDIPLNIDREKLGRILRDHGKQNNQSMTIGVLKQLPSALANPLMIFTSATKPGRLVVALELKDEMGVNVVVPIQLDVKKGRYDVNIITSAYGRRNDIGNVDYKWFRTNAEQGRLEYIDRNNAYKVLGMTKEKAHSFLQSVGVQFPMEAKRSKGFSPLRILDESDLVKVRTKNPTYYQTAAPEKDLIVYHNVSAEKLKGAIELGGLPMPSLAITKKDIPFGDFGEITLIGNKDMIDPRKSRTNEVFSRDAYTVRKPTVNYEEPSEKDEAAFRKKYSAAKEELEKKGVQTRRMNFSAYDGLEALARMENDEVIKYYYVKNVLGKDVAIKEKAIIPNIRNKSFFEEYPGILKALKDKKILKNDFSDLDKAAKPYYDSIQEDIANKKGLVGLSKRLLAKWTTDGHINQKGAEELYLRLCDYEEDLKKKPSTVIDRQAFVKDVNQIIEEHGIEKFISYVQSEFDNLYKEKYLWDNGKKYKFTLDNVVKLMKKYRGTNNEGGGGINYGFNSLLAFLSKKFTSIRDIRNSKSKLASNAKELAKYKRAESLYNRLQDEAIELRGDYDDSLDMDLAELIKDTRDGKTGDMHGFPENKSFIKHIHDFLDAADKVTTDYFEAKPARKVSFDEFSGAIVPEDTPQKMVDFLESKGIEVRKYNQDIEGDRQAKAEELAHELNVYFQTAYHGSPYSFEHFDLGSIGTGEGYRAYGWGLYFSKDRKIAQKYQEMLKDKGTTGGSIYEVDIPDNDVLLDWDKPIREQPLKVKEAIIKFMKEHPDDYIADGLTPENFDDGRTGEQWYKEVGFELSIEDPTIAVSDRPRLASETLNGLGIKGITYEGREDGRCFVVFDDKAISIINRYNQEINKRYQGSYDRNQNVIEIFDGANQSTVIHEGAHMFLSMLEDMSNLDEQSLAQYFNGDEKAAATSMKRMQDDLSTIRKWASYTDEHLAEYKGTALEKEFFQHAADIADGKEGAEERWIQERFARGFEKYLMDGSAPTKEMQGVFRRFKKWLTDIYKTAKNLGNVKLTPEIKDVFDKMLATEDEINAWAAQRKLESIDKAIDVNKSELGNLKEWAESVKQKAQEKAMSYYLSMVKEDTIEQFKGSISTEEAKFDFLKSLSEENEIYTIEQVYNSDNFPTKKDKEDFLKLSGYTEETFKQKLKKSGGTSEEQWKKHIADMVQQYKDEILTPETIKQMAEDVLNSPEGLQKKSRIESMLLEKKVSQYINLVTSMQLKLKRAKDKEKVARDIRKRLGLVSEEETAELDKQADTIARSEEKISKLEKQVKTLKEKLETAKKEASDTKSENKSRKESAELLENNLQAIEAELEKERAAHEKTQATQKDTEATVADLEGQLRTMVDGLRESRKGMWVDKGVLRKDAYNTMSLETISHATSWKWWQNKAKEADAKAMKCAAENDWDGVAYYKKVEAQNLIMSRQAKLNVDEIKKALHGGGKLTTKETDNNGMERYGILGLINRIGRKENPVLLQGDARYFIQHLAYMCGMLKSDAPKPIDDMGNPREFNFQALMDMIDPMKMKELDGAALLSDGTDVIPQWVLNTYFSFDSKPGKFGDLTMNDFRDIVKCMKAVYKIGRREYEGNTLGTSFDNAAKEIINGLRNVSGLQYATSFQRKYLFTDKQKAMHIIGKYARSLALPEMYIERLGEAAYKYLYKPIDTATTKQREMKEQAIKDIQKIFGTYSRKEWLEIRNDRKYRILGSDELFSKEELLVVALNWGTESNRERIKDIVHEVNPTYDLNKSNWAIDLQEELETYLTDKDWDFVEKVWDHLNSYYAGRSKVQNDLYGVPMGKVPGITFTLKSGRKIRGQYYTIRYDKELSQRTSEQSVNDMAKQGMKGTTTFGVGMGSTKTRTGSGGQILDLSLDLYPKFVDEAIQHTTMREATVDVYKLLCRKDVEESIVNVMGQDGYDFLKQWVVDNWHSPIVEANDWVGLFNRMRCKFNFATMAYRTSTALLNALNIFPLMNEMGPMNALYAVAHFYKDIPYAPGRVAERYRFIKEKSSFMRDRESNMDRDLAQGMRLPVAKGESKLHSTLENGKFGTANINRYGFWLITKTDYMLSMPQWLATYEGSKRKLQLEHPEMKLEDIDAESVRLADKAVRQTFGSGEIKDRPEIMRNGHWLGQITAFYSYTNLVANWFIRDFYKWKDTGSIRPLAESILFCWVLNAVFEGCMRAAWDDKDDDDKYKNKIINAFFNGGPIGGIPLVRECLPWMINYAATGKKTGEITPDIGALDVLNYIPRIMDATKKGDYIEVARNVNKVSNRSYLGFSDTLSDGFWSTVRFCTTENQYTLADLLRSIIFDRPLKAETKKSKKKEDKK